MVAQRSPPPVDYWSFLGRRVARNQVVFFSTLIILYIVIFASIINLSLANGDTSLWVALMSTSLGALLPQPKLKNFKSGQFGAEILDEVDGRRPKRSNQDDVHRYGACQNEISP